MHSNNLQIETDCVWAVPTFDKPASTPSIVEEFVEEFIETVKETVKELIQE